MVGINSFLITWSLFRVNIPSFSGCVAFVQMKGPSKWWVVRNLSNHDTSMLQPVWFCGGETFQGLSMKTYSLKDTSINHWCIFIYIYIDIFRTNLQKNTLQESMIASWKMDFSKMCCLLKFICHSLGFEHLEYGKDGGFHDGYLLHGEPIPSEAIGFQQLHTCWWFRNPAITTWDALHKIHVNDGIATTKYELVSWIFVHLQYRYQLLLSGPSSFIGLNGTLWFEIQMNPVRGMTIHP